MVLGFKQSLPSVSRKQNVVFLADDKFQIGHRSSREAASKRGHVDTTEEQA